MFHHDPTHIGISTSSAPDTNDVLWSYQTDYLISSSPIIAYGRVYASSLDGKIYCFDMMNGHLLWNYTTLGQITSTPVVANGTVYVGSQDSKFYCLDAEDGGLIWIYDTAFMIESSATIKDDKIFFGTSDGYLYCLNANTGSLIWSFPTGNVIWSSPAVTENYVYFGDLNGVFFCLDISDGGFVWSYITSSGIWSSPTVYEGRVFFGSNDNNVYCLNANDGSFIWSYDTGNEVHSSPAIAYGNVYIGSSGTGMYCLDVDNGDLVWEDVIKNGIWSPPSIADGKIFYATDGCCGDPSFVFCLDAFNGEKIWEYNVGGLIGIKSSPAIAAGKVVVTTGDGRILVFGENIFLADANGPYYNLLNEIIQFNGDVYGGSPGYTWFWDFGDNETSTVQNPIHTYKKIGKYNVILTVKDSKNNQSIDLTYTSIIESINYPPTAPIINGPTSVKIGIEYDFFFNSTDPDGDYVKYIIVWGDGNSNTTVLNSSGVDIKVIHSWSEKGEYIIIVKAEDANGLAGSESIFKINAPRYKMTLHSYLQILIEKFFNFVNHFKVSY